MNPSVGSKPPDCLASAEVAASKQYQYRPVAKSEIRCVRIDSSTGLLRGRLSTHDRLKGGFIAISYEWGASAPTFQDVIWITDEHGGEGFLPMTQTLSSAIKDLLDSLVQDRLFFIDQLCINQQDNKEKSVQVAEMAKVYKHADQVVCYLGSSGEGDSEALELLQRLNIHFGEWFEALDPIEFLNVLRTFEGQHKILLQSFRLSTRDVTLLRLLEEVVYEGGWTTRLWMCQEVLLNKELSFLRGSRLIVARSIFLFLLYYWAFMEEHNSIPTCSGSAIDTYPVVVIYKAIHMAGRYDSILTVLDLISTRRKCSDPRDKIYGVLGLVKDDLGIVPNYAADVADVYTDLAQKHIEYSQSLDILKPIFQQSDSLREPDIPTTSQSWPTWVPPFESWSHSLRSIHYATGSTIPKADVELPRRVLRISGWQTEQIDTVCGILDIRLSYPLPLPFPDGISRFLETIVAVREALIAKGTHQPDSKICHGLLLSRGEIPSDVAHRALQSLMNIVRLGLDAPPTFSNGREVFMLDYDQDPDGTSARELFLHMDFRTRALCITKSGNVVATTTGVRSGDIITVFPGGSEVYVLRAAENDEFILVGPAFAQGYMGGESIRDPEWEEDLRHLIKSLLEQNLQTFDDVYTGDISHESRTINPSLPDLRYCVGCLTFTGPEISQILHQEDRVDIIQSRSEVFLHKTSSEQVDMLEQALLVGPGFGDVVDVDIQTQWRRKWWNMIEKWIEAGLMRAPQWMANMRAFTIR